MINQRRAQRIEDCQENSQDDGTFGLVTKSRLLSRTAKTLKDVVDLGTAEIDLPPPESALDALHTAIENGYTHYTSNQGIPELLNAIISSYQSSSISPSEVLVTNGAGEALFVILMSMIRPGDEVVIPDPTFHGFAPKVKMLGGSPIFCKTRVDWHLDLDEVEKSITERTKLIMICNPNNPTGAIYAKSEIESLLEIASSHKIALISDESYSRITYDGRDHISVCNLVEAKDSIYVVNSFSKTFAMTGLRLGYLITSSTNMNLIEPIAFEVHGCVNPIVQYAGIAAMSCPRDVIERMIQLHKRNRDFMVRQLNKIGLRSHIPEGGLEILSDTSVVSSDSFVAAESILRETRVLTKPGIIFGPHGEGHVRFAFGRESGKLREASKRLSAWMEKKVKK